MYAEGGTHFEKHEPAVTIHVVGGQGAYADAAAGL